MNVTWKKLPLKVAGTFRTSKAIRTDKETLWVSITHESIEGWGEAAPIDTYHQNLDSAEATMRRLPDFAGHKPFDIDGIVSRLTEKFPDQLATVAAIDAALHDWMGKKCGMPTVQLLGLSPAKAPLTSFSIGIDEPRQFMENIRRAAKYPILKIKLGTRQDEQTLEILRETAPDKIIRVDANMAWSVDRALKMLPVLARHRIEFLEQPLPANDHEGLRRLKKESVLPIIADESCIRPEDVLKIADCVDGINIKLSKCGGIHEGLKMIHLARASGLKVMLGSMIESSLGISAAAQLAPLADWLDLDGHLLLAEDPFTGLGGEAGKLTIGTGPGLGVKPKAGCGHA